MKEIIESAVNRHNDLLMKEIDGEHYRLMKTGWRGSLWIHPTATLGYRIELTGEVISAFQPEVKRYLGRPNDTETPKGYLVWFLETENDVREIIDLYGAM